MGWDQVDDRLRPGPDPSFHTFGGCALTWCFPEYLLWLGVLLETIGGGFVSEDAISYDSGHIQVPEEREAIRKRPGMYIGSTGERGLRQLVIEVADRPVNEILAGRAGSVEVTLMPGGGVCVADDGPGVPVEAAVDDNGGPCLEALLTRRTHAGSVGRDAAVVTPFSTGPSVANALSSRLTAEVRRDGVRWVQEYARGVAVTLPAAGPAAGSGTSISFWPDSDIFGTAAWSFGMLTETFRELALLNRCLDIMLTDGRQPGAARRVRLRFPGGARDFVALLDARAGEGAGARAGAGAPTPPEPIAFEREDARMAGTLEVALRWCDSREEQVRSFANSRPTPQGGTHATGFRIGATDAVNSYARSWELLTPVEPDLSADQVGEGLTAIVSVKLDRPEFLGATKGMLGNVEAHACVREAVRDHLGAWLDEHPEEATAVVHRIVRGARARAETNVKSTAGRDRAEA